MMVLTRGNATRGVVRGISHRARERSVPVRGLDEQRQGNQKKPKSLSEWMGVVMQLGEERTRVEGERKGNLKALWDALGEVARRETDTLTSMVERARAETDRDGGVAGRAGEKDDVIEPPFRSMD